MNSIETGHNWQAFYDKSLSEIVNKLIHANPKNQTDVIEDVESFLHISGANDLAKISIESAFYGRKRIAEMLAYQCEGLVDAEQLAFITDLVNAVASNNALLQESLKLDWKIDYLHEHQRLIAERCEKKRRLFGGTASEYLQDVLEEAYRTEHGEETTPLLS